MRDAARDVELAKQTIRVVLERKGRAGRIVPIPSEGSAHGVGTGSTRVVPAIQVEKAAILFGECHVAFAGAETSTLA